MNLLREEGILPNKEYIGIVDFYDSEFTPKEGRGRIRGYIGKELGKLPFKLFEVFGKDIKTCLSLDKDTNTPTLLENEIVKFKVKMSSVGLTATDIVVLMKISPSVVKVDELLEKMSRNLTLDNATCCPIGPSIPGLGARIRTYNENFSLEKRNREEEKEILPKIIKLSKEGVNNEQKT